MYESSPVEEKLTSFRLGDQLVPVSYVETVAVKDGVSCDVYAFEGDTSRDLAVVTVLQGAKTPLQRVLKGETTVEGIVNGVGALTVWAEDGTAMRHTFGPENTDDPVAVKIGERMQWSAEGEADLVFYELCTPPYEDGRFENLTD